MASLHDDDGGWERAMPEKKSCSRGKARGSYSASVFAFEELAGGRPLAAQAAELGHGYSDFATSAAPRSSRIRRDTLFLWVNRAPLPKD
jgi:hypothetical protein